MEIYRVGKVLFDRSARLDGTLEGGIAGTSERRFLFGKEFESAAHML